MSELQCPDCPKTFSRQQGLTRHQNQTHGAKPSTNGKPKRKKRRNPAVADVEPTESEECTICPDPAVMRVTVPEVFDWKVCEAHAKVTLRYVEPL